MHEDIFYLLILFISFRVTWRGPVCAQLQSLQNDDSVRTAPLSSIPLAPSPGAVGWAPDSEGLSPEAEEDSLESLPQPPEKSTSIEIAIVTVIQIW